MSITYKEYTPEFREKVCEFIEMLQDYIVSIDSFDRVIRGADFGEYYTAKILDHIQKHGGQIYLAFDAEQVIGMVIAVVLPRTTENDMQTKNQKYGEIEKLFVLNSYRGKGIGKKLLAMGEDYLIKHANCDYTKIIVFGDNKQALSMYKKLGYKAKEYSLLKPVGK